MNTLANRLKTCREDLDLTQAELAKKAGLKNQSIIGSLESGYRKSSSYIPQIAQSLGVDPLWLATGKSSSSTKDNPTITEINALVSDMDAAMTDAVLQHIRFLHNLRK